MTYTSHTMPPASFKEVLDAFIEGRSLCRGPDTVRGKLLSYHDLVYAWYAADGSVMASIPVDLSDDLAARVRALYVAFGFATEVEAQSILYDAWGIWYPDTCRVAGALAARAVRTAHLGHLGHLANKPSLP